jgi:hypothetical protein
LPTGQRSFGNGVGTDEEAMECLRTQQHRRMFAFPGFRTRVIHSHPAIPSDRRDLKFVDLGLGLAPVRGE